MSQKNTVVINALSALRGGGQTYLLNLLRCAKNASSSSKIMVITNTKNTELFKPFESDSIQIFEAKFASINIILRVLWEVFVLPFWLAKNKVKQYYAPGGIMVSLMPPGCKSYTALRNMLPFDKKERQRFPILSYMRFKLWLLRFVFLLSYRMADGVIFISHYSRNVVESYLPNIKEKSVVIYHGINENFRRSEKSLSLSSEYDLKSGKYYLYVSILDMYKAQKEVIESWQKLINQGFKYPLVLVGPNYNEYGQDVVEIVKGDNSGLVRYLGSVEYGRLPSLYQNARALIFASSCECCPNILLEKLASGRPVFSSDIQPMPEFASDAAMYFDPYDKNSLLNSIIEFESDNKNLGKYARLGLEKSRSYDWENTTNRTFSYITGTSGGLRT